LKKSKLRLILLLASLSLVGLLLTQLFWVKNAYDVAQEQFDHRVNMALHEIKVEIRKQTRAFKNTRPSHEQDSCYIDELTREGNLDSLIHRYLDYHKLTRVYYYQIINSDDQSIYYASGIPPVKGEIQSHKTCLSFMCQESRHYLKLTFVSERTSILVELSVWIILASFFIFLAGLSFTQVMIAVVRQKKLAEIKNDFINNMTHEFKTPIATISMATEVLLKNEDKIDLERQQRYTRVIHDENNRLKIQVDRLLHMALLDNGDTALNLSLVDIHEIIRQTVDSCCLEDRGKPVETRLKLGAHPSTLVADPVHLTNVLINLIDNAVKYSGEELELDLITTSSKKGIEIAVIDNGIGMSTETLKHIFEKFYRAHTGDVHNVKGFGLGLYYVKTIVEAHDGSIKVKSEPQKGTRFDVYFPFGDIN
jgi:two-component system, OmpR family, phosphate regulon sensor histidine kinase PhoR